MRRTSHIVAALVIAAATVVPSVVEAATYGHSEPHTQLRYAIPEQPPFDPEDFPLQVYFIGFGPDGLRRDDVDRAIQRAIDTWNAVPCGYPRLEFAGHRSSADTLGSNDVPVIFARPDPEACFPEEFVGYTSYNCGGNVRRVFLNTVGVQWSVDPVPDQPAYSEPGGREEFELIADVESVLTHEFGHVLGLSHSDDRLATMYANYRPDGGQRTLALDDKLGICQLYPIVDPPPECADDADCAPRETCRVKEGFQLCEEYRARAGEPCAMDDLVCEGSCLITDRDAGVGYCTHACQSDADCPDAWSCTEELIRTNTSHCLREDLPPPGDDGPICTASPTGTAPPSHAPGWLALTALLALGARRRS